MKVSEENSGIILRAYPSKDADLVLHVLLKERGKHSLLARNARRSKKRFGSVLEIFDRGTFQIASGRGSLLIVQDFTPLPSLRGLRENLDKLSAASLLCESIDFILEEGDGEEALFDTVSLGLEAINEAKDAREVLRALFLSLATSLRLCGFSSQNPEDAPSARKLVSLLDTVEQIAERTLESRPAVTGIVRTATAERDRIALRLDSK